MFSQWEINISLFPTGLFTHSWIILVIIKILEKFAWGFNKWKGKNSLYFWGWRLWSRPAGRGPPVFGDRGFTPLYSPIKLILKCGSHILKEKSTKEIPLGSDVNLMFIKNKNANNSKKFDKKLWSLYGIFRNDFWLDFLYHSWVGKKSYHSTIGHLISRKQEMVFHLPFYTYRK